MDIIENITKVSVVIPCRNEEKYIAKCIDSIIIQSYGIENIEVMIADGLSDDKTAEIIKEYGKLYPEIKYILNEKKTAPAAMNLGIENSTGEVVIIFGAHAYMDKEYVKKCVEKLNTQDVECVGGKIINLSEGRTAEAISLAMGSPFGVGNALFRYSDREELVDTVAFGAYKREVFNKIGLFDEEFVRNQDDEFNFRLTKSGGHILLSPEIISHYYTRGSFNKLWNQYFQYGFWKVRGIQKHKRAASIRHLVPAGFVLGLLFGTGLSIFFGWVRYLFIFVILLYLVGALIFAQRAAQSQPKYIHSIILAFIILHISYGIGFLEGIYVFYFTKNSDKINKNTKLSR
ncbi:MAG: succinoglycan biosynthesis protein exoa [Clostridiales bacterium]|jgi:glycosyltransferase involved in cell wall biosynthesis|nr:succinoglycan biosynthesis protein exoa [Clostridiales bacterium]